MTILEAPGSHPVYTIGQSTRTIAVFVDLLRVGNVDMMVDIRSVPRSRTNPQFNLDVLPKNFLSGRSATG